MLAVEDLNVFYGRVQAVRAVRLDVAHGEIVCLVGSNGAGKSSTLLGIMGLVHANGTISVDGDRIDEKDTAYRIGRGLALVPEGRQVFPGMSVRENLLLGFRGEDETKYSIRVERSLSYFPKLSERYDQLAGTLSGGEQQMLAIGRALMSGPSVLLLDEPTLGLAPVMVARVASVLQQLRGQGLGILIAEQNLHMALGLCDRGHVIKSGEVTLSGSAEFLRNDARVRSAYLGGL